MKEKICFDKNLFPHAVNEEVHPFVYADILPVH